MGENLTELGERILEASSTIKLHQEHIRNAQCARRGTLGLSRRISLEEFREGNVTGDVLLDAALCLGGQWGEEWPNYVPVIYGMLQDERDRLRSARPDSLLLYDETTPGSRGVHPLVEDVRPHPQAILGKVSSFSDFSISFEEPRLNLDNRGVDAKVVVESFDVIYRSPEHPQEVRDGKLDISHLFWMISPAVAYEFEERGSSRGMGKKRAIGLYIGDKEISLHLSRALAGDFLAWEKGASWSANRPFFSARGVVNPMYLAIAEELELLS